MTNPNQEPPASSKAPNQDLKDMDVLCTFKIKIESQDSEYVCIKDKGSYQNQDQDNKLQSGTSQFLQNSKSGHKGHGCSLHLQSQNEEQKLLGTSARPNPKLVECTVYSVQGYLVIWPVKQKNCA